MKGRNMTGTMIIYYKVQYPDNSTEVTDIEMTPTRFHSWYQSLVKAGYNEDKGSPAVFPSQKILKIWMRGYPGE